MTRPIGERALGDRHVGNRRIAGEAQVQHIVVRDRRVRVEVRVIVERNGGHIAPVRETDLHSLEVRRLDAAEIVAPVGPHDLSGSDAAVFGRLDSFGIKM